MKEDRIERQRPTKELPEDLKGEIEQQEHNARVERFHYFFTADPASDHEGQSPRRTFEKDDYLDAMSAMDLKNRLIEEAREIGLLSETARAEYLAKDLEWFESQGWLQHFDDGSYRLTDDGEDLVGGTISGSVH